MKTTLTNTSARIRQLLANVYFHEWLGFPSLLATVALLCIFLFELGTTRTFIENGEAQWSSGEEGVTLLHTPDTTYEIGPGMLELSFDFVIIERPLGTNGSEWTLFPSQICTKPAWGCKRVVGIRGVSR